MNAMKRKTFIHKSAGKVLFGTTLVDDAPRADMFLPAWLLAVGLLLSFFGAIIGTVAAVLWISALIIFLAAVLVLLGVAAVLWWKNQTIRMLPDDTFEYSDFWGNKAVYRFSDMKGLKKRTDSMTLFVADRKIYIDSIAIVTDRLSERINKQLEEMNATGGR